MGGGCEASRPGRLDPKDFPGRGTCGANTKMAPGRAGRAGHPTSESPPHLRPALLGPSHPGED